MRYASVVGQHTSTTLSTNNDLPENGDKVNIGRDGTHENRDKVNIGRDGTPENGDRVNINLCLRACR